MYTTEENGHGALRVQGGLVATQLRDLAEEQDVAADEAVEVGRGDARGRELFGHGSSSCSSGSGLGKDLLGI